MESPDSSWLPEALDLPWPPKLPASVLKTICALSASCVSVSSRSQSLPGVSFAPPWWAPVSSAPPWWASVSSAPPWWASVSSAPPWWASVSSAPPWWASVLSAPPWWAPDLPESPHVSADLPESPHVSADLPESPHVSADLPESPHVSADLPESPHVSADLPESPHVSADLPEYPHATAVHPVSLHISAVSSAPPWWAPVSLAPHGPGPPFPPPVLPPLHRPPGLCRVCVKCLEAALWGGGGLCHDSGCLSPHYSYTSPMDYNSHHSLHYGTHISTIALITQLSPITNKPWLSCHTCTSFTHPHISSTLPYTRCEVLLCPADNSKRYSCFDYLLPTWSVYPLWLSAACPWPCLPCVYSITCLPPASTLAFSPFTIQPFFDIPDAVTRSVPVWIVVPLIKLLMDPNATDSVLQ